MGRKKTQLCAGFAGERRVSRGAALRSRGEAQTSVGWCGARELCTRRSFRVQKSLWWASNLGRFIPWLYTPRCDDTLTVRRRVNAGMLAGACRCADGMCLMCWRCVGSRTSEGAPPRSPRSRTPHHPIALRAKATHDRLLARVGVGRCPGGVDNVKVKCFF